MSDPKRIVPINELPEATLLNDSDTLMLVQNNTVTKQATLGDISNQIIAGQTYSDLKTESKQIVGAINEIKGVELIGTINAYESTVVLYSDQITSNSKIRVFFETYGMSAKDVKASSGQVVVKIDPQEEDVRVLIHVT